MRIRTYFSENKYKKNVRPEPLMERLHFLDTVSSELVSSFDLFKTIRKVSNFIVPYFADFCSTVIVDDEGKIVRVIISPPNPHEVKLVEEVYEIFEENPTDIGPLNVFQQGKPEMLRNAYEIMKKLKKTHPRVYTIARELKIISYIGVPLIVNHKVRGALTFASTKVNYSQDELKFAQELAIRISRAFENEQLYNDAQKKIIEHKNRELRLIKESEEKWSFLAKASKLLSSSLDFKTTLTNVANLAVPEIADWCMINLKDEEEKNEMIDPVVVNADPKKISLGYKFLKEFAPNLKKENVISLVIRTGTPLFVPLVDEAYMASFSKNKEQLNIIKSLDFTSVMIMPLLVHGDSIGAITLGTSGTRQRFTKTDTVMVQELASRASLAIENAILHERTKRAIAMRDEFMSIASHELRTPITSVKMYAQFLKRLYEKSSEKGVLDYFERMDSQVDKMTTLIRDLLDVSRIEHGKFEVQEGRFALGREVREAVQVAQITAKGHTIYIEGEIHRDVYGDKTLISQVLSNLLSNAIRYSPDADKIIVKLSNQKDGAFVSVQDFGIGIEKKYINKLFDPFYRGINVEKEAKTSPGMGIGLYVSSEIIKRHGSKISVTSTKGKGSTFSFTLPYAKNKK